MLNRIISLFKSNKSQPKNTNSTNNATNIHGGKYSPTLISGLIHDHKELLNIAGTIQALYDAKKWSDLSKQLSIFREKIYAHLITENINLYIYLQRSLKDNPESLAMMQDLRKEMTGISKAVTAFLTKYTDLENNTDHQQQFGTEFKGVCEVLLKRIECEEKTLYPMYAPIPA
ncbi:hemerythrin domain-containing protein [Entomomonas sp. E2T0]|uniref:hemerythrin domain-containing protein n=1 Tax=Entomomonas sp. E2T0 TaxID=2930213 RepID=UPI0022281CDE|nr:hemerythrin domain-containing protein [Entomomonas sp. E2T0]UYZ82854.1 hemerythrin domain-containing protein [Entomomonas sp. E2T0]